MGAGGPGPPWQKTGPLLEKSFFKKLINFNKKISVQNWHILSPLSQKRYLLIIMCPVMSAKVGPLNILCGPSWAKILVTPLRSACRLLYKDWVQMGKYFAIDDHSLYIL